MISQSLLFAVSTFLSSVVRIHAFSAQSKLQSQHRHQHQHQVTGTHRHSFSIFSQNNDDNDLNNEKSIDPSTLFDMDIIIYKIKNDNKNQSYIGAIQEDMTLAPLSAWTTEPAFGTSIEFVVDEEDRWKKELEFDNIVILELLTNDEEEVFSYGSRQVGGGKGPGNPHGEESELIYYVENQVLDDGEVDIPIKPELEILW